MLINQRILIFSCLITCFAFGLALTALAGDVPIGGFCCQDSDCSINKKDACDCHPDASNCELTADGAEGKYGVCCDPEDLNTVVICPLGPSNLEAIIKKVIDYIFYLSMIIIPLLILYAAFLLMTAAGEPERIRKGRAIIIMAAIGLAVILSAKIFYGVIVDIITK